VTKKTRTILVIVLMLVTVTATSIVIGKLIGQPGKHWGDEPSRKK
jgi:hypothetical protein